MESISACVFLIRVFLMSPTFCIVHLLVLVNKCLLDKLPIHLYVPFKCVHTLVHSFAIDQYMIYLLKYILFIIGMYSCLCIRV